jgi:apolipoprotein N-acyltransferase
MRSLEFERPFLRVSNTGITSVVDHQGRLLAALPALTRGVLQATVQGREGLTPFAWWSARFGQWPLWLFGIATLLGCLAMQVRPDDDTHSAAQT